MGGTLRENIKYTDRDLTNPPFLKDGLVVPTWSDLHVVWVDAER